MIFRRKQKAKPAKKPRLTADDVIVGAAKTIGAAIGTASGAVEIGKQTAAEARNIDTGPLKKAALEKKELIAKKATETRGRAARQGDAAKKTAAAKAQDTKEIAAAKAGEAKKLAAQKAEQAKKVATAKAAEVKQAAGEKMDEMREAAADTIAPKKKRGLLRRIREGK